MLVSRDWNHPRIRSPWYRIRFRGKMNARQTNRVKEPVLLEIFLFYGHPPAAPLSEANRTVFLIGWAILPTPEMDEAEVIQCLGHSNWTICSRLSHFCSNNFPFISPLYWEANSYYPRGLIMGKGSFPNSRNEWDRGVWVPGAFILDHLHPFQPILFWEF